MTTPRYQWQPTTAEIAERYGLAEEDVIRFDHNTSPFPSDWAPSIIAPMARRLNDYPGASYSGIRGAAGRYLGVDPDMVVPGAGVDELIGLVAKAFLKSNQRATAVTPTYPLYQIVSLQQQCEFIGVLYEPGFVFPTGAFGEAAQTSDVTWLCVPNNPTGDRVDDETIASIIDQAKGLVVIDAAYSEFAGDVWAPWVERYDDLIVMHTMSKAFGLAGLRVGYSISSPKVADRLDAVRPPGSISSMSAELATIALGEPQRMHRLVERLAKEKVRMADALTQLGIGPRPSETNFLLSDVGPQSSVVAEQLMSLGLVVREFPDDHPLANFLRFTVRTPNENDRLVDALWRQLP